MPAHRTRAAKHTPDCVRAVNQPDVAVAAALIACLPACQVLDNSTFATLPPTLLTKLLGIVEIRIDEIVTECIRRQQQKQQQQPGAADWDPTAVNGQLPERYRSRPCRAARDTRHRPSRRTAWCL